MIAHKRIVERVISIHSPPARGDVDWGRICKSKGISIHSPHARGDARRGKGNDPTRNNFNPLPSHGGRRPQLDRLRLADISIHSPHTRGDHFNSHILEIRRISIHSPHTRGDAEIATTAACLETDFNSLPSHEGRPLRHGCDADAGGFQSTPLIRGETCVDAIEKAQKEISIHSPHTRGDYWYSAVCVDMLISIHSPHTRGDRFRPIRRLPSKISIHSPHTRGDRSAWRVSRAFCHFNPLPSYEGRRLFAISQRAC